MRERDEGLLYPAVATVLLALMLEVVPFPDMAIPFRPDWVALTVIYWSLMLPRRFGIGAAWLVGLALDTLKGALLGQHALALAVISYATLNFHLRIRVFPLAQQTATVLLILVMYKFLLFWADGVAGQFVLAMDRWAPLIADVVVWPILAGVFARLARQAR